MDFSSITFTGRLVRDPEVTTTQAGMAMAKFAVAVSRYKKDETDFLECTAFKERAEFIQKHLGKGNRLLVSGRLQIDNWEDKDGNKKKAAKIMVNEVRPIDWKEDSEEKPKGPAKSKGKPQTELFEDSDDLPF